MAVGRLDGSTETLPNPDLFVFMYVRREAVLSSQIEGTQASLIDVLEFEAQAAEPGQPEDVAEVVNYVAAMNDGLTRLVKLPVSLRLIREIHARLMQGVRGAERNPGEFRTSQNWVGPPGSTLQAARYVPPPPHEMRQALDNFENFLHSDRPMPALIKVGIAHSQFETIQLPVPGRQRKSAACSLPFFCARRRFLNDRCSTSHITSSSTGPSITTGSRRFAVAEIGKAGLSFSCGAWRKLPRRQR